MRSSQNVGDFLLAARHGFYWSAKYKLFIRIQDPLEDDSFQLDVCPAQHVRDYLGHTKVWPNQDAKHLVWWELPRKGNVVLDGIQPLQQCQFPAPASLHIDKTGALVS